MDRTILWNLTAQGRAEGRDLELENARGPGAGFEIETCGRRRKEAFITAPRAKGEGVNPAPEARHVYRKAS
jgi:hypothetical protein